MSWAIHNTIPKSPLILNYKISRIEFNQLDLKMYNIGIKGQKSKLNPGKAETMLENFELPFVILREMIKLR